MINAIDQLTNYQATPTRATPVNQQIGTPGRNEVTDQVTLSPGAKLLSDTSAITLDQGLLMSRADAAMKLVLEEMGIPEGTPFEIEVDPYGRLVVEGDHEKAQELEDALNNPQSLQSPIGQLANNLKGAANAAIIQRIAKASQMAGEAAEQNPSRADYFFDWMLGAAKDAQNLNYRASFGGGNPARGSLMSAQGIALGNNDDLKLPT
jgi:hypothetical protein